MIGKGFWQKRYLSKHTGSEIDAAVGAAQQLPLITAEDAGKVLLVGSEGNIVTGEQKIYRHIIEGTFKISALPNEISVMTTIYLKDSARLDAYTVMNKFLKTLPDSYLQITDGCPQFQIKSGESNIFYVVQVANISPATSLNARPFATASYHIVDLASNTISFDIGRGYLTLNKDTVTEI